MTKSVRSASLQEQAEFLDEIISRCIMRDGETAATADLSLVASDVEKLRAISNRLWLISPDEEKIRRLVTGR